SRYRVSASISSRSEPGIRPAGDIPQLTAGGPAAHKTVRETKGAPGVSARTRTTTMHELTKRLALIGLVAILGGCNSTDALTPQVDVGGSFNSPPVTQSDLDRMSAEQTPAAPRQSAFTETGDTGSPAANTLQAQADALARDASRQQPTGGEAARVAVEEPTQAQETAAAAPAQSAGSV